MKTTMIVLASRPSGVPTPENFRLATADLPLLRPGEALVKNALFSVDPYMRGRMDAGAGYMGAFEIGRPLEGRCVGYVVESKDPGLKPGDAVVGFKGWRDYWVAGSGDVTPVPPVQVVPLEAHLGPLGNPGFTAYIGLTRVAGLRLGEPKNVYVSAAGGAVGSVACQIAKMLGCNVVGSAGSDAKVTWLRAAAGVRAFNYRTSGPLAGALAETFPRGIDVYFDNVGGDHLDGALANMAHEGVVALCGMIAHYNGERPTLANLVETVTRRLRLQGFIAHDYHDRDWPEFEIKMRQWLADGAIAWESTVSHGVESAPAAFIGLFLGNNVGKAVVKVE